MVKLFIGTPAFDGRVHVAYSIALAETVLSLASCTVGVQIHITTAGSLLVAERNRILKTFLETDCTHILCVDSDIAWSYKDVKKFLDYDVDIVAACYLSRLDGKGFFLRPFYNPNQSVQLGPHNLIKAEYIPAGFMLIKREVIEKMNAHFQHLYFQPKIDSVNGQTGYLLFNTEIHDGEFWGEDYVFCRRVREAGIEILVDPHVVLDHAGNKGALIQGLTSNREEMMPNPFAVPASLEEPELYLQAPKESETP